MSGPPGGSPPVPGADTAAAVTHIQQFKDDKKPRSANEMAAVVAYYLANLASAGSRKGAVTHRDIETHFKIAHFPLPQHPKATLPNAKNAGYFDLVGD